MPAQPTIPKLTNVLPAFDPRQLSGIGLQHVQRLASKVWTDYNVHDPGITTLELLSYALTDLAYRATFPVQDIVAIDTDDPKKNAQSMAEQFFTAKTILTNRPLTERDYRKLLIDLKGVKNAWLKPSALTYYADPVEGELSFTKPALPGIVEVKLAGLYDITVEYMDTLDNEGKATAEKLIWETLHQNRNLCEDFVGFSVVESQEFIICAEIELASEADVVATAANILFGVQEHLSPTVPNHSLSEMLGKTHDNGTPYTVEEIFDGPTLLNGFIDDDDLQKAELRTEIRLSDIIGILMKIDGVQAIRDVVINPISTKTPLENKWLIPVEPGRKPALDQNSSRLVFYKRNMPIVPDQVRLQAAYADLASKAAKRAETTHQDDLDIPIPLGRYRKAGSYYSFQNHFPDVYGLSETSLPSDDEPRRKALAYQMKAYLLFYDQFMADYLAQLNHVRDLFSTDPTLKHSYFCQAVDSFVGSEDIYSVVTAQVPALLQDIAEGPDTALARRSRFLDHLIARFAERFNEFVQIMDSAFGASTASLIKRRCDFLNDYPRISSTRGTAYDYTLQKDPALWTIDDVSGLERRLARLLGIDYFARAGLAEVTLDADTRILPEAGNTFSFRILRKGTAEVLLRSVTAYPSQELARRGLELAIIRGSFFSDYKRSEPTQGKFTFTVIDGFGTDVAQSDRSFNNTGDMNEVIRDLVKYLRTTYPTQEGIYLIENILLRPGKAPEPFLPICADPGCADCAEADPYTYRVHIILPGFSGRFTNMDFRRYAEDVIRSEMPAHILPKICWIGPEDMANVEKSYRVWLMVKAGLDKTPLADALGALINALNNAKSMYPSSHLGECGSDEMLLLDRTALGSMS